MNHKMIFSVLGRIVAIDGVALLVPTIVGLLYREWRVSLCYGAVAFVAIAIGLLSRVFNKAREKTIFAREGFVIVGLAWILMSVIGAAPLCLSGDIPSFVDAFFETISGFTTTGASIIPSLETISHASLMWRSFTHWIGGMGILVLMVAIFSDSNGRTIHIMRAEMPGPVVDKMVPRARETAKILYLIYIGLTLAEIVFLLAGGVSLFESFIYAFGTAGTGGFGIYADSIAAYSPYIQWVITVFMLLFGVNFNLYYLILIRKFKRAAKSEELWIYLGIVAAACLLIGVNVFSLYPSLAETARVVAFQVASVITTTGYSTVDFSLWPSFAKAVLLLLFFIGGCAGSTAGGLKVSRIIIAAKSIRRHLRMMLHPREVSTVKFEGRTVDEGVRHNVSTYFVLYLLSLGVIFLLVSIQPFDLETNLTAAVSCFNNVGPAYGRAFAGYADYSPFCKLVLSAAMLLGRLELYPLMLTFNVRTWSKK